ncbi:MAG: 4-hydroxythreonine-4-phosphate dehydrogenase PdxA [Gammaproteobacteria bacterium]|nr:4-hydroxythreonine-4-phosphate dehydrogenase PdxA [Gammaproteobacteria bacterium]
MAVRIPAENPARRMAVTMGDASGVGPEIVLRLFAGGKLGDDVVIYGDAAVLHKGAELLGLGIVPHAIDRASEAKIGVLNVVDLGLLRAEQLTPGKLNNAAGAAALAYVERATLDALANEVAGVVTLPMNKEATQASHPGFIGHTEFIAAMCDVSNFLMMLTTDDVAVTFVSTHVSLRDAIEQVTPERLRAVIDLTHETLLPLFEARPRIAVCGLNPHAGENRMFGNEDAEIIAPVINDARSDGLDVSGPHPADTVFYQAVHRDRYDAVVCMYHDQGHAPMKLISFETGVNVTIGLPIVRTSVDHGTAFDIAWQGKAFTESLGHALAYAWKLVGRTT